MTIQILTSDTVKAEALGDYIAADWSETKHLRARFSVAFGPVTRLLFLQDMVEGEPPAPPRLGAAVERREHQWLRQLRPHHREHDGISLYELRTYDVRIGLGERFLELMLENLPVRQRYSPNFGIWSSLSGRSEQVLHLWGYRSFDERNAVRAQLKDDAVWSGYTATILPMLENLNSTILAPLPMKRPA